VYHAVSFDKDFCIRSNGQRSIYEWWCCCSQPNSTAPLNKIRLKLVFAVIRMVHLIMLVLTAITKITTMNDSGQTSIMILATMNLINIAFHHPTSFNNNAATALSYSSRKPPGQRRISLSPPFLAVLIESSLSQFQWPRQSHAQPAPSIDKTDAWAQFQPAS
jgi:hypothetical protein